MAPLPPCEPRGRWCCLCPPCTGPPSPRAQHDTYRSQGTEGCASSGHRPLVTVNGWPGVTRSPTADTGQEAAAELRWPEPCHQGLTSHPVCCEVRGALQAPHAPDKKTEAQDVWGQARVTQKDPAELGPCGGDGEVPVESPRHPQAPPSSAWQFPADRHGQPAREEPHSRPQQGDESREMFALAGPGPGKSMRRGPCPHTSR